MEKARIRSNAYYHANKDIVKKKAAIYREKNREKQRAYMKVYNQINRKTLSEKRKAYYQNNKSLFQSYWKKVAKNPERIASHNQVSAKRRAYKGNGALWGKFETKFLYTLCRSISNATGVLHHVDHIFPLYPRDNSFCGLHVPENLRIIPAIVNMKKHRDVYPASMGGVQTQGMK